MSDPFDLLKQFANVRKVDGPRLDIDALIKIGWFYHDFPRMPMAYWSYLKAALGKEGEDFHSLTDASYGDGTARGQLLCAPQSRENMRRYREANPLPAEPTP